MVDTSFCLQRPRAAHATCSDQFFRNSLGFVKEKSPVRLKLHHPGDPNHLLHISSSLVKIMLHK